MPYSRESARARSFLFAVVVVFTLVKHTKEDARANHVAARDLFIALSIDMVFTLPVSLFFIHVIMPKLIAALAVAEDQMKSLTMRLSMSARPSSLANDLVMEGSGTPNMSPLWENDSERGSEARPPSDSLRPSDETRASSRWTQSVDHATGLIYYFDSQTGRSQWEPPLLKPAIFHRSTSINSPPCTANTESGGSNVSSVPLGTVTQNH